ncbi:Sapep family Mn(2+)-dependent dipeptidase [Zongyangia hominis]|uniref:Sapep family Mn(2+)-dependent dipeptidase n=1 Tax=Zongyangia hominis TaxID=2763677 RepID=A0A926EAC1_9FIRM|nr:Sapep family Mn(2+)-dependent dipeptidase [Zongyangia hominis]MBC8570845.1 Sapep family Mn(2+)-dependent dipeptidase [Zongyangia hominis]
MKVDKELKTQILDWIDAHRDQMVRDIGALVNIESVSVATEGAHPFGEGPAKALDAALEMGRSYGFRTQNHRYYAGSILMGNGQRELGILTHLDVVPAGPDWLHEPYHCTVKDGKLIGRGVADDKGPAVAALYAMRCLYELAVPMVHSVRLIMGCSEETGSADMQYYVDHCPIPDFSIVPDAEFPVCNGEKGILAANLVGPVLSERVAALSGGEVTNAVAAHAKIVLRDMTVDGVLQKLGDQKGDLVVAESEEGVSISAKGVSTHAAFPEGSVNAIHKLCKALVDCGLMEGSDRDALSFVVQVLQTNDGAGLQIQGRDDVSGETTCIGGLIGVEEGRVVLNVNIRACISADLAALREHIAATCEENGFTLGECMESKPLYIPADSEAVTFLTETYNELTGQNLAPYAIGGGTYAREMPRSAAFGAARPGGLLPDESGHGGMHQPDEAIAIEDLLDAAKIYAISLLRLDGIDFDVQ